MKRRYFSFNRVVMVKNMPGFLGRLDDKVNAACDLDKSFVNLLIFAFWAVSFLSTAMVFVVATYPFFLVQKTMRARGVNRFWRATRIQRERLLVDCISDQEYAALAELGDA